MTPTIGIRREDKSRWERQAPFTPARLRAVRLLTLLCAAAVGAAVAVASLSVRGDHVAESGFEIASLELADLVVVSDDLNVDVPGCDAISVHDVNTGMALYRGPHHNSIKRLAANSDLTIVAAHNSLFIPDPRPEKRRPWMYFLHGDALVRASWQPQARVFGERFAWIGGHAFLPDDSTMLVAVNGHLPPRGTGPYGIEKLSMADITSDGMGEWQTGASRGIVGLDGVAAEVLVTADGTQAHLLLDNDTLVTIDTASMNTIGEPVELAPVALPWGKPPSPQRVTGLMHALLTPDEQYVLTNRWSPAELNVVDLRSRTTTTLSLGHDADIAGGIALNRAMGENEGLLAVHANSRVMVLEIELPDVVRLVGSAPVPGGGVSWDYAARGPLAAIAWSGDGSKLIAAAGLSSVGRDSSEFVVYDVTQGGERIQERTSLVACPWVPMANRPNDILTANGRITPVPTPTGTPPPTVTATKSPTATDTATSLPPSPTPQRVQLFLPIALAETCDPRHQRSDIVLVIDTSSSMSGRKILGAQDAARAFVSMIDLGPGRSQIAVVRYDREAEVVRELTRARSSIDSAIRSLRVRSGTHIDKGLRTALAELRSPRRLDRNQPVMILLTDGVQTGTPGEELSAAAEVRAARVWLYTIGLGADVDESALRTMAGVDRRYFFAPDSADLARIHGEIARDLMCPDKELWGGR